MKFNFNFRLAEDRKDIDNLINKLLAHQRLNYKNYDVWVEKAVEELFLGYKKTMLAFSEDILVGNLIFQPHKSINNFYELKHGRTISEFQKRYILSFMFRQVEVNAKKQGKSATICDICSDRLDLINFLMIKDYKEVARANLYGEGYEDSVFIKSLF